MSIQTPHDDHVCLPAERVWRKEFSICCLVTRWSDYRAVRAAFAEQGFSDADCEYLVCDNGEGNRFSGFDAVRRFLQSAEGKYVLIVHQDAFPEESCEKLRSRLRELDAFDPKWGVVGNAGKSLANPMHGYLSLETHAGTYSLNAPFMRVDTIDENVMLIRNGSGITVSADLEGFHLYAFDLCSVAFRLGFRCYVIDYHWRHWSPGSIDQSFLASRRLVEEKLRAYVGRVTTVTTCTSLYWGRAVVGKFASECRAIRMLDGYAVHRAGFLQMYREASARWPLFRLYYNCWRLRYVPLRVYQWIYWRYRMARKRIGRELTWWRKNWRGRIGF